MKRERKMLAIFSLSVAFILVVNVGIYGRNGGEGSADREWNCGGSCHNDPSAATVTMYASTLTPNPGDTITVTVDVTGAEVVAEPLGVFLVRSQTTTNSMPSLDGWVIVSDPSGVTAFNYYEELSVTGGVNWTWTLQAPMMGGTYNLYAREHHGDPGANVRYFADTAVGLTFTIVAPDNPPTFFITNPGSAPGEQYFQGTMLPIDWAASDDNPWPSGGNVVNLSYGPTPAGGTPITNLENVGAGTFSWDTSLVAPGTYYINGSVYDSLGQITFNNCNNSFEILPPDNPPSFYITGPGSAPGETYNQGTTVPISWAASDDNPWPATGLIVNITYGPTTTGGTPIANNQDVATIFSWDTTGIAPGTYYVNASVWDSGGQTVFANCNNSFEILLVDTPPSLYITNPGSTPGELYGQGSLITISWAAADESPWPAAGNVVNISYGATPAGGTPIANDQDVTMSFSWDTTGVPVGFYFVNTSVYDSSGNTTFASSNNSFEITAPDTNPPIILNALAMPSPQELGLPTNISATITDDTTVDSATVFVEVVYPSTATVNISMGRSLDLFYIEQPFMEIGLYDFTIWAADTSGNWASAIGTFQVIDTTPPSIVGTTAIPSPQITGGPVNISASVTDLDMVASVELEVFDPFAVSMFNVSMLYDSVSGRYYWETTYVTEGTYTFDIWASDPSMNWGSDSGSFVITSMIPPTIANVQAQPSPQEAGGAVNISAVVTDDMTVFDVWVEVSRPDMTIIGNFSMTYDSISGEYYYESTYTDLGTHTFTIWAQDNDGLFNSSAGNFVIVDTTPPTIVHIPVTTANLGAAIPISADVTDAGSVGTVNLYYMNVGDVVYQNTPMNLVAGNEYSGSIPPQSQTGTIRYYIEASDASSNMIWHPTTGYHVIVIVDNMPPAITDPTVDPPTVELGNETTISANITDDSGVTEVHIFITGPDDSGWMYQALLNTVTGKYEKVFSPTVPGQYGYTIWARDGSDNWGTIEGQFNATKPAGKIPNPPSDVHVKSVEGKYLLISWVPPNQYEDGNSLDRDDVKGYYVYRSDSSDGPYSTLTNQPVKGELYLDGGVSSDRTYYYKVATIMIDDTASGLSDFAEGELEEEGAAAGATDILPWLLAVIFLVLWVLTLVAYMMGRKKEEGPGERLEVKEEPSVEEPAYTPPIAEPQIEEPPLEEVAEEDLITESDG
jgi:hypothetical protein